MARNILISPLALAPLNLQTYLTSHITRQIINTVLDMEYVCI